MMIHDERREKCSVCGTVSVFNIPLGAEASGGREELDGRPAGPQHRAYREWVHRCPRCGYVARWLDAPTTITEEFLQADAYQSCNGNDFRSEVAAQNYQFYMIGRETYDLHSQLHGIRGAIWACDDEGDAVLAQKCRKEGVDVLDRLLGREDDDYFHRVRMDFMRRSGQFPVLRQLYENKRFQDPLLEQIRQFQMELADAGDVSAHNTDELTTDFASSREKLEGLAEYRNKSDSEIQQKNNGLDRGTLQLTEEETAAIQGAFSNKTSIQDGPVFAPQDTSAGRSGKKTSKPAWAKGVLIAGIVVVLIFAGFFAGKGIAGLFSGGESNVTDSENEGLTGLNTDDISILSTDWDWDSKVEDDLNDQYQVYAIMCVENNSSKPITKIEFTAEDSDGDIIENAENPSASITAQGYIKAGKKGIMVADIRTDKENEKIQPSTKDYKITGVYTNEDINDSYEVPTGKIIKQYGPNGDYYDVVISNPNEDEINQDAWLVAARVKDDVIRDSDATGRLDTSVPGNTPKFEQDKAFIDPNLPTDNDKLTIYVIDTEYYKDAK